MRRFVLISLILSVLLIGCHSTTCKVYVSSIEADLQELRPLVEHYVNKDELLSDADRKARMAVIEEMEKKTDVMKKEVE